MIVLLFALVLSAAPQSAQPTPPVPPAPATIRGRIVRSDNVPLRLARVRLTSANARPLGFPVLTDEDGRYEFADVTPGSYYVLASKSGYLTIAFGQRRASDRGDPITAAAGAVVEHVDLILPRAAIVAGVITDENGEPLENTAVSVWQIRFSAGRRRLTGVPGASTRKTDDRGRYRLFGLQPGRYLVGAVVGQLLPDQSTLDVPGYSRTYFPGTANPTEAEIVDVRPGQDAMNIDFSLVRGPTARVSGIALSSDGEPVQGLTMIPSFRSGAVAIDPVGARTRLDGSFEFENVAPGEYVVQAARPRASQSAEGEFGAQYVTVSGADVDGVIVQMSAGSEISGRVVFEDGDPPKPGGFELQPAPVDLDLTSLIGRSTASADAYENWTFAMRGINGPRRLRVTRAPEGWMLRRILHDGIDITDAVQTFGTIEQSMANVEVVMTRAVTAIGGSVTDRRGAPAIDAAVVAFSADRSLWYPGSRFVGRADVRRSGAFIIPLLAPGDYRVAVVDKSRVADVSGEIEDPDFLESLLAGSTRITLTDGGRPSVALKMPGTP